MLCHKDDVVHHGHIAQRKLDGIPRDPRPVALQIAVDALLGDAQDAAGKVEEDLGYAPAYGRPSHVSF